MNIRLLEAPSAAPDIARDALQIARSAIEQVLPDAAVRRVLSARADNRPVTLFAIGKAAWRMARAACDCLGARVRQGVVITKYGHSEGPIGPLQIMEAGHPIPDENGVRAARAALELARPLDARDEALLLISGGGSALFELPAPGLALEDIADMTRQLLACGADIGEINCIRKRLSAVKGGRFAQAVAPACVCAIVLSDVLGDPLDAIASGPAYPDSTTCEDARRIAEKYGLTLRPAVRAALATETPKRLDRVETHLAGNLQALCAAAAAEAERLGYRARLMDTALACEAGDAGRMLARTAREEIGPVACVWGGETVVRLHGDGRGGRSQELALSAAEGLAGLESACVLAIGSDGTDGPTDAAGGCVTGSTYTAENAEQIRARLANHDSYPMLRELGGLVMTGPTGTNVNDLYLMLKR